MMRRFSGIWGDRRTLNVQHRTSNGNEQPEALQAKGKPGVFATLDAGATRMVGLTSCIT